MKRYNLLLVLLLVFPQFLFAQDLSDAFRLSHVRPQGTARSAGMGNAFGSLGGDFTSISINPAGSAVYQTGEFMITPGYFYNESELTLNGTKSSDNDQTFRLYNIGAVGVFKTNDEASGIVSVNYAIGYNRLANYNSKAFANFSNSEVSWLDDLADYATNEGLKNAYLNQNIGYIEYRDWTSKLAYETYLVNPATDNNGNVIDGKYTPNLNTGEKVNQYKTYSQSGHMDEYLFNLSVNFNHSFYVGATIGFVDIDYKRYSLYQEDLLDDNSSFSSIDEYKMDGHGVNFKIGTIFKPTPFVRLGLALHSPTFYDIDDQSFLDMESKLTSTYYAKGLNEYEYDFNSPWKAIASGAVILHKSALISADLEYMNYANMRFRRGGTNGNDGFSDLNSSIEDNFKNVFNLRLGAEVKLTNQFAVRAGYERYANPFEGKLEQLSTLTDAVSVYSCGFGYMINSFSLNVAYSQTLTDIAQGNPQSTYDQLQQEDTAQKVLVTLGFRF